MDLQDIDEIELSMPPKQKCKCYTRLVTVVVLLNSCCLLLPNANGQLLPLQPRMVQKRSDRATPALRGLLDTLLQPTRSASSSNGWKGFVFMDPLFKVSRSPPSSDSLIRPQQSQAIPPSSGSQNDPSVPSFPMDNPQYETESAPIPYIIEPPIDMYQPMASNTRYSTAKHPYNDYYDDEINSEPPIPRIRIRSKSKSTTTTKKPNHTPAISIGPASGGGTAIRLGKAKITFKKGSISLGPVEDHEMESKRSNDDKSSEKHVTNKRPHNNYPDESDSTDYPGPSSSSRHQSSSSDDRHHLNKANLESRPVYTDDDYGPKYATNYKTSASGYYQSYKPYHNLDTLIDKQVNLNQDTGSNNFSPQPVYPGNTRNSNNKILTSSVTESYNSKNDYDYEDSVVTERTETRDKKPRDKRRDETVAEDDNDNDEVTVPSLVTRRMKEKRRKGNDKNDQSNKRSENDEDNDSKIITENVEEDDGDVSETSTEKVSSSATTTTKSSRKKSSKPKNQQSTTTATTTKSTSRSSNRNKTKSTSKPTSSTTREDSSEDKKLVKEHRNDDSDKDHDEDDGDHEEDTEKGKTIEDNEDEDNEEDIKSISKTSTTTQATPTISSNESKKRKTNSSRQSTNSRRKANHRNNKQSSSNVDENQQFSKSSTEGTVSIGNQSQSSKTRKGSIESVSISPGTSSSERGGTIVTLKMSDDPSLGVIGGSTNSKKPGTIYQIRLTSKIPTESASVAATVPIITKASEGPVEVTKDEISINRLIKMMQETLEDIRKTSASSSLPPLSSSSPCPPPSVIIEPIPPSTTTTSTTTPKPSSIISSLMPTTNRPVDPFLNLHHGNITILPASMGNVSDIVEMLVKTSKFTPSSSSSERQKQSTRLPTEINITTDNPNDKRNEDNDYSIDLDSSSINTNSDRPQAEESSSKGLKQNLNEQQSNPVETANGQTPINKQLTNDNLENGDDVPIIVVLLPPEDELPKDSTY